MRQGPKAWAALLATGAALEAFALHQGHNEDTLSHATRVLIDHLNALLPSDTNTDGKAGKAVFAIGSVAFTTWFVPHIIKATGSTK